MGTICDASLHRDSGIANCKNYPAIITANKSANGTLNNGTVKQETTSL